MWVQEQCAPTSERTWTCPNCGAEHSRDENAGKNLRTVGLDILALGKPSEPVERVSAVEISYAVFWEAGSPSVFTDG
ncbi:MAG: transposase [Sphaerochaeta sp.]|nr:transposase [Sphaerochaeta sp.]